MKGFDLSSFLRKDILFIQSRKGFRFGTDSFLLADFVKLNRGESAIDLGTGCGVIPVLLIKKYPDVRFIGIDVVEENVEISNRNARINGVEGRFRAELLNVRNVKGRFEPESFDVVITNPPFIEVDRGKVNVESEKAVAKHEILAKLEDFIGAASYLLRFRGRFYMVCHVSRFIDTVTLLRKFRIEPKTLQFIHPRRDERASLFLIEGRKGGGKGIEVLFPLVLYENGEYTQELKRRYETFFNR